jgi:hypothetical protein
MVTVDGYLGTGSHACGVTTDDRAYCWGSNEAGELGDGVAAPEDCARVEPGQSQLSVDYNSAM